MQFPTVQNSSNESQITWDHEKEKLNHSYSPGILQDHFYPHKYLLPRESEIYILQDTALFSSTCNLLIGVVDLIAAWSIGYNELSHFSGSTEWNEKVVGEMINCMNLEWQIRGRSIISICRRQPSYISMIFSTDKGGINLLPYRKPSVPLVLSISSPGSWSIILKKQISLFVYAINHIHFKLVPKIQSHFKF